jgi:hypothetical protein
MIFSRQRKNVPAQVYNKNEHIEFKFDNSSPITRKFSKTAGNRCSNDRNTTLINLSFTRRMMHSG